MERNIQLLRARHALAKVRDAGRIEGMIDEYLSAARGLPAEIRMNGLGQAIAVLRARGVKNNGAMALYRHVSDWMCHSNSPSPYHDKEDPEEALLDAVVNGAEHDYRQAYVEIDAYLAWLKRFADALLEKPKDGTKSKGDEKTESA